MTDILTGTAVIRKHRGSGAQIVKPPVFGRLVLIWAVCIMAALALRLFELPVLSKSVLWGVSVCLAPSVCFAWYVFRFRGASRARESVNAFYRGESIKFVLTAGLFSLVFTQAEQINVLVFFLSFIVAQLISWLVAVFTIGQRQTKF